MLNGFLKMIEDVKKQGETLFARITNKADFERVVYASYLIAIADGNFDSDEKTALAKLIAKEFKQFNLTDIIDVLNKATEKTDFDMTFGVGELLSEIGKATGDTQELIVRTACFMGAADGNFDNDEKDVARKICTALKLSPSDYGL